MNRLLRHHFATVAVFFLVLGSGTIPARGDGPSDNVPTRVRRVPKLGITLSEPVRKELDAALDQLQTEIKALDDRDTPAMRDLLPDVLVLQKAVSDALRYQEFFAESDVGKARGLLTLAQERIAELRGGGSATASWANQTGLVVRGYVSKIDGSVQPYGLVIPKRDSTERVGRFRLDVWFHGRGETLSEVNFLDERRKRVGEFSPPDTIVLHPYGRYCNAFKFAGEVDVLEAIASVQSRYRIDPDRISVRGFSMGGAACWQFAVHYPDRWFAANPGAGFAETPRFLKVYQNETLKPSWYEQKLWHLYDCTDVAANLAQCPTVAYSGELDGQKQAADVMAEALENEGIRLTHIIGPGTKHAYHPEARREVDSRLASLAAVGRREVPDEVRLVTYTLKYNRSNWVTIDALNEHWARAEVSARLRPDHGVELTTRNVNGLTLAFLPGRAPFPLRTPVKVTVDGTTLTTNRPLSDRSWSVSLDRSHGDWAVAEPNPQSSGPRKRHDLQGPIDDAFMDSFVIVRPTGKSAHPAFQSWCDQELARAIEHWRRQFRGEPRVKDDLQINDLDIAGSNLVLWGDPESNAVLRKIAGKLPIAWNSEHVTVGQRRFDAEHHALVMIAPNPLAPSRYVVLNSGYTYRDYDYLNNARQVPKLPDWAVIDLRTPPDARAPGKVVSADFFNEQWELRQNDRRVDP